MCVVDDHRRQQWKLIFALYFFLLSHPFLPCCFHSSNNEVLSPFSPVRVQSNRLIPRIIRWRLLGLFFAWKLQDHVLTYTRFFLVRCSIARNSCCALTRSHNVIQSFATALTLVFKSEKKAETLRKPYWDPHLLHPTSIPHSENPFSQPPILFTAFDINNLSLPQGNKHCSIISNEGLKSNHNQSESEVFRA